MQDAAWIGVIWNVLSCTSFFFHRPCLVGFDIAYASGLHGARLPVLRGKYTYSRTARWECGQSVHGIFRIREMCGSIMAMARPNYDIGGASVASCLYLWVTSGCKTRWYSIGISPCLSNYLVDSVDVLDALDAFVRQGNIVDLSLSTGSRHWLEVTRHQIRMSIEIRIDVNGDGQLFHSTDQWPAMSDKRIAWVIKSDKAGLLRQAFRANNGHINRIAKLAENSHPWSPN